MSNKATLSRLDIYWGSLKVDSIEFTYHIVRKPDTLKKAIDEALRLIADRPTAKQTCYTILHLETKSVTNDKLYPIARYNFLGEDIML